MTARGRKRNLIVLAVAILVIAIVLSSFVYLNSLKPYSGSIEPMTLAVYPSEYNSLIYIANEQGYFSTNGLQVTLKDYTSGSAAVTGLLKGEADVATASEFAFARNVMQNASILTFGSVSKYLNVYLVVRSDKGINSPSDLSGKKIGVTFGTANQFFLGRYLEINKVDQSHITLVNVNFEESPNALANGTVDAVMTFQPYINQIQTLLDGKILVWPAQANQFGYFEGIASRDWVNAHPDLIVRFLKAMIQAQNFNINHQDQSIAIVSTALNETVSYETSVWQEFQFSVTLDQSSVLLIQEEGRWLISNNLTSVTSVPNFSNSIYIDGLKSVKPDAVNIIGLGDQP
ncbi:MAG TPA: NrtA/SsuA/CpmA family ABC transporter substrate-binding protein [Candidatus Nanoarchaeia archaeon]|nr:NrtA/SsuA/CpmA family ABC transporter substrate-binding protein [Candidatus Nanoarchaeia archaeon]